MWWVVGGGDTAMEESLFLTKSASKVTIVHRRNEFRASEILQQRVFRHPKIDIVWNSQILEYAGIPKRELEALKIKDLHPGTESWHPVGGLFMAIGHSPNTKGLENTALELHNGYVAVRDNIFTNIDGVFAAGDVHDTEYRQAVTAAGFGCMRLLLLNAG